MKAKNFLAVAVVLVVAVFSSCAPIKMTTQDYGNLGKEQITETPIQSSQLEQPIAKLQKETQQSLQGVEGVRSIEIIDSVLIARKKDAVSEAKPEIYLNFIGKQTNKETTQKLFEMMAQAVDEIQALGIFTQSFEMEVRMPEENPTRSSVLRDKNFATEAQKAKEAEINSIIVKLHNSAKELGIRPQAYFFTAR